MELRTFILLLMFSTCISADGKSKYSCEKNDNGEEHCHIKDSSVQEEEDEEEACFFEEKKETLYQWDPVEVGHEREVELHDGRKVKMITRATKPRIFEIPEFLTDEECDHIIGKAQTIGLHSSGLHIDISTKKYKTYTFSQAKDAMGKFDKYDYDGDRVISKDEIKKFAELNQKLYLKDEDMETLISTLQLTQLDDGKITEAEFKEVNTGGLAEYLNDLRESDPRFRDRFSEQTWLRQGGSADPIMRNLRDKVRALTKLPRDIVDGGEPLQVVHYYPNGHYHAHFDGQSATEFPDYECCHFDAVSHPTSCRLCRYITIIYYLNDVEEGGETAFPVADQEDYDHMEFRKRKKADLYNLSEFCHNASMYLHPKKRMAVMWYNHHLDDNGWLGEMDYHGLHGGCDVKKGEKWIANNWLTAPPSGSEDKVSLYLMEDRDMEGLSEMIGEHTVI